MSGSNRPGTLLLALLLALLSAALWRSPGTGDIEIWQRWYRNLGEYGLVEGYARNASDYPPLSSVVLFCAGRLADLCGLDSFSAIKLSVSAFHLATSATFWWLTRHATFTVILHVGLLLNSVLLGYLDVYFAPFLLLALRALQLQRWVAFTVLYGIACLMKWQPVILAPFVALHLSGVDAGWNLRSVPCRRLAMQVLVPGLAVGLITGGIFGSAVVRAFEHAMSHGALSANALNFNWLYTYLAHVVLPGKVGPLVDGMPEIIITNSPRVVIIPRLLFVGSYVMLLAAYFCQPKTCERLFHYALGGYLAYFTFNIGVHENHLALAAVLATLLAWCDRSQGSIALFVLAALNVNLYLFYGAQGVGPGGQRVVGGLDTTVVFALVNVLFFLTHWVVPAAWCLAGRTGFCSDPTCGSSGGGTGGWLASLPARCTGSRNPS